MRDFKTLQVWQKSHQLTLAVYAATAAFLQSELYGLTSQVRRACASIPANIAEGAGRNGDTEFAHFCSIAMGSASELEYHLLLAHDLGFLPAADYVCIQADLVEVRRMLNTFMQRLRTG